jgi:hypothetical protein
MRTVAVLFADRDSIYKTLPGVEVYDIDRDARTFPGGMPVVAHPPCRTWGCLAHFAKAPPEEHDFATWAIEQVRRNGGVVEHPGTSRFWKLRTVPKLGEQDSFGGFVLPVFQWWFGHRAEKATRLLICGVKAKELPPVPFRIGEPEFTLQRRWPASKGRRVSERERSATPPAFAEWLIELARRTRV